MILQQPPHPRHTDRLRMCTTCTVVHWLDPFRFCSKLEQFTIPGGRRVTQFQNTIRIDAKQLVQVPIDSTTASTLPAKAIRTGGRYTGWSCSEVTVRGPPHRFAMERARRQGRFHGSVPRGLEHRGGSNPPHPPALPCHGGHGGSVIGARYSVMGLSRARRVAPAGWKVPGPTASFMIPSTETTWLRPSRVHWVTPKRVNYSFGREQVYGSRMG